MKQNEEHNGEEIYSTQDGTVSLGSPVKNKIMALLHEGPKEGHEIRSKIDRSKSTISVHLSDLRELGLIKEEQHPSDNRKKIFSLNSKLIGRSIEPEERNYNQILENLKDSYGNKYGFIKSLFHAIRYGMDRYGLDVYPALKGVGKDIGREIASEMSSTRSMELLEEVGDFWENNGLGLVEIEEQKIKVYECFDCSDMPKVDRTLCSLDEGILEGIIEEAMNKRVQVIETECFGMGHDHCTFVIENI